MGYSSTVITSRAFQAAMLVPQNRHCQPIIADSLLPKNRKKQQTAEISMEPPVEEGQGQKKHEDHVLNKAITHKNSPISYPHSHTRWVTWGMRSIPHTERAQSQPHMASQPWDWSPLHGSAHCSLPPGRTVDLPLYGPPQPKTLGMGLMEGVVDNLLCVRYYSSCLRDKYQSKKPTVCLK